MASLRGDSQLSGETRSCLSQTGAGFLLTLQTPPTFDSLRRTGGGGEVGGRGSTHELLGRGAQKDHPVLSTGKHFGTTMLVALSGLFLYPTHSFVLHSPLAAMAPKAKPSAKAKASPKAKPSAKALQRRRRLAQIAASNSHVCMCMGSRGQSIEKCAPARPNLIGNALPKAYRNRDKAVRFRVDSCAIQ